MNDLIGKLRQYISVKNADGLIINTTNEFLVEYNQLALNSRYKVSGFTGSTGDLFLTLDKLYLFVDGRYHEQADLEVDKSLVDVVKLQIGQSYLSELALKVKNNSKILMCSNKNSLLFANNLTTLLDPIEAEIELLDEDPVEKILNESKPDFAVKIHKVPIEITKYSADEKFSKISDTLKLNDYVILTSLEDVAWLTNLRSFDIPYSANYYAKALISKDKAYLFTDSDIDFVGKSFEICKLDEFTDSIKNIKNSHVFVDQKSISLRDFHLINESNEIRESSFYKNKTIKNDLEIKHMKSAFARADKALDIITKMLADSKVYSELDYYQALEKSFYDNGALSLSFKPIVAAGKNTSIIHYSKPSKDVMVKDGDFLLVDCGGYYEGGLATDITRTFIKGTPSIEQKQVYTTVLKANLNTFFGLYDSTSTWKDIDSFSRAIIDDSNLDGYTFGHSTGHGVGISVHEFPPAVSSSKLSETNIQDHVVFTIEPGMYKPNVGGVRLENTVFVSSIEETVKIEPLSRFTFDRNLIDFELMSDKDVELLEKWEAISNERNI